MTVLETTPQDAENKGAMNCLLWLWPGEGEVCGAGSQARVDVVGSSPKTVWKAGCLAHACNPSY
jgi:hypothetical protein